MVLPSHHAFEVLSQRRLLQQQLSTSEEERSLCNAHAAIFLAHIPCGKHFTLITVKLQFRGCSFLTFKE